MSTLFILVLSAVMFGGSQDALMLVDSQGYWQQADIRMDAAHLLPLLAADPDADASSDPVPWLDKLGDRDAGVRAEARDRLLAMGPRIRPALEPYTRSDDPEIALSAREIRDALGQEVAAASADRIRRLMAIRGLGELKAQEAIPVLTPLLTATAPFEAQYAAAALATIRDEAAPDPGWPTLDQRAAAIDPVAPRLPSDSQFLARLLTPTVSLEPSLIAALATSENLNATLAMAHVRNGLARYLLPLLRQTGNFRVHAAMMAAGGTADSPVVTLVIDGVWDPEAVQGALRNAQVQQALEMRNVEEQKVGDRTVFSIYGGRGAVVVLDSHRLLIGVTDNQPYPLQQQLTRLLAADAPADGIPALTPLWQNLDRSAQGWAVAQAAPLWKDIVADLNPLFGKLRDLRLTAVPIPDETPDARGLQFRVTAVMADPKDRASLKEWVDAALAAGIAELQDQIARRPERMRFMVALPLQILQSMQLDITDSGVVFTARVPYALPFSAIGIALPIVR